MTLVELFEVSSFSWLKSDGFSQPLYSPSSLPHSPYLPMSPLQEIWFWLEVAVSHLQEELGFPLLQCDPLDWPTSLLCW